jgi:peptidoglycan/LPS O-acetylase OafA/YrhL
MVAIIGPAKWMSTPLLDLFVAIPLIYIVAFTGATNIPPLPFFKRGDHSYGMYLYGFPVMQSMRLIYPTFISRQPVLLFLATMPFIIAFAWFSWHFIETPILEMRKRFSFVARQRLAHEPLTASSSSEEASS